mmetsp:Transcript_1830/g.3361  ORF Transcript_1830/g.3361 Transcript_1830/m.3361 type:complete len:261 (+) Transcript_1830:156-938(+)
MLAVWNGPGINAGDVGSCLPVVCFILCTYRQLQGLVKELCNNGAFKSLTPSLTLLNALSLLHLHAHNLLCSFMEGRQPQIVLSIRKTTPQLEAWSRLTNTVARRTEARAVYTTVARQPSPLLWLLTGSVHQRLGLTTLLYLHQSEPAHCTVGFGVLNDLLRDTAQLREIQGLGVCNPPTPSTTTHDSKCRECLRVAAINPPLLNPFGLWHRRGEDQHPTLREGSCPATVPLLHYHCFHANNGIALKRLVLLLGPLTPDGH